MSCEELDESLSEEIVRWYCARDCVRLEAVEGVGEKAPGLLYVEESIFNEDYL